MKAYSRKKPWVNVAVFERLADGEIVELFLNNRRIEARTYNDKLLQVFLFLCPPHATFRVQVRGNAYRATTELLNRTPEIAAIMERAVHCPSCGSLNINFPQMTRKFFLPTVLLHLGIIFRVIHHEAFCEQCHYTWQLPVPEKAGQPQLKVSSR